MGKFAITPLVLLLAALAPTFAHAQAAPAAPVHVDGLRQTVSGAAATQDQAQATADARTLFQRGVELVQAAQWGEALSAFERSTSLVSHPLTTFNIGACQRALGRYTLARRTLAKALAEGEANLSLPPSYATDAKAFIGEIDGLLAHLTVSVQPAGAVLTVDGRPLLAEGSSYVAGVLPPGRGAVAPAGKLDVLLDPGVHLLTVSLKGYTDVVVNKSLTPGSRAALPIALVRLPATLSVASTVEGARVKLGSELLGVAPITVQRPAGPYRVLVEKQGFDPYSSDVKLSAGETTSLRAKLVQEHVPITKRWWFWTAAVGVVAGAAVATFAATRPEPEPPPYDGGSTGWIVMP